MKKPEIDIELIAKYYNGELDGRAMQQLEERALEDPFLAEAMEGFSELTIKKNDFVDLNERLKDRIRSKSEKGAGYFGFKNWTIAASIVVLIGLVSIYLNLPDKSKNSLVDGLPENAAIPGLKKEQRENDFNEDTVLGKQEVIDQSPVIVSLEKQDTNTNEVIASSDQIVLQSVASSSALAIDSLQNENVIASDNNLMAARSSQGMLAKSKRSLNNTIKGKVTDAETKTALAGVSVTDIESGITATTDHNGEFKIPAESEAKLSLRLLGFQKKELEVFEGDSLQVSLKPENATLSEVVVVGYGAGKVKQGAGPKDGWAEFRKYLNENNELETNETGAVVVEFVINANGSLSDFKILKSLSKLADARAIYLIRNYSSWQGSSDGTANKVKVTLRFR